MVNTFNIEDFVDNESIGDILELPARDVLKIGYSQFEMHFNPFYASTKSDIDVVKLTSVNLLTIDRDGNIVENGIEGEERIYNGVEYKYQGVSNISFSTNPNGITTYRFDLRQDVKFADGVVLDCDDAIFYRNATG